MREDLQTKLFQEYPAVFAAHTDPETDLGRSGIQCGDGWYRLLGAFSAKLTPMLQDVAHLSNQPTVYAVEERQGRLYILLRPLTGEMDALLREAAEVSERICSLCGASKAGREHDCDARTA